MATKWINVNGGDWNTAANWDNGVPSPTSQAIFDAASFAANGKVITASALMQCQGLDVSAADQTFTIQSAVYGLELYGDFVGSTNCTFAMTGTAYVYSKATMTLTTNGKSLAWNRWYIDTVGGTVTNGDDTNVGSTSIYVNNGTLNTNGKTLTGSAFIRSDSSSNPRSLIFGSSAINIGLFLEGNMPNFTLNAGTSVVNSPNYIRLPSTSFALYDIVYIQASYSFADIGNFSCNNLTITGTSNITTGARLYGNIVYTGNLVINGINSENYRVIIISNTTGTARTITGPAIGVTITNADFQDIIFSNPIDLSAQTDIGNCGGNSGITFPPAIDCYIKHTSGAMSVSNVAKWVTTDGGSTQARVPLPQDRAWGTVNSFTGASTVTMDCPRIGSIDLSGVTQAVGWTTFFETNYYGNYILGNSIITNSAIITFRGRELYYINTYAATIQGASFINKNGTYLLLSNLNVSLFVYNYSGTFDLNGFDLTAQNWANQSSSTEMTVLGRSGTITLNRTSSVIFSAGTNYDMSLCKIILMPSSGSSDITFSGGGKTFNNVHFSGTHAGNFDITGSNTFNNIKIDAGRKVRFTAGTTQNIASLDAVGTSAAPITISSVTAAEHTLNYTGSQWVQCDWLNLTNSKVLPVNRWFAGKNSVNGGGNTNWNFKRYIITPIITLIRRI